MDSHDSTKHYVNGPEAFLHTLLAEFKDAQRRVEEVHDRISKLVTPPVSDMSVESPSPRVSSISSLNRRNSSNLLNP